MNWKAHIHSNPKILLGKPVVKGTRLSVEFILGLFSEGWAEQQLLSSYPTLTTESIQAIFAFAAAVLDQAIENYQRCYSQLGQDRSASG